MAQKRFLYKIYDSAGAFITTWTDVISEPVFTADINGGLGELVVTLARNVSAFGEDEDVAYNNQLRLWVFDGDEPTDGVLIYSGYISRYEPIIDGRKESISVTFLSYIHEAARIIMVDDGVGSLVSTNYGNGYGDDLIGTMTTDSAPSPLVASASTTDGSDSPFKAFDESVATRWQATTSTGWLKLDFGSGTTNRVGRYTIGVLNTEHDKDPKDWVFEGSNDDSTWTLLHTVKNEQGWGDYERRTYTFENDLPFRYYRITFSDNNGGSKVHVVEMNMFAGVAYARSGATTLKYLSQEPNDILKDLLDRFTAAGGKLDYDTGTTDDTGSEVSYTFNTNTYREALEKIVELCPMGWYFRIGADDLVYLKAQAGSAEHSLILGEHITYFKPEKRTENVVNRIFFRGGDISGNKDYLFKEYIRSGSISTYGEYAIRMNDERVKLEATMDLMAERVLDTQDSPEVRITLKIQDNNVADGVKGYDIESLFVGQMVKILNSTSKGENKWDVMIWDTDSWDYDITNAAAIALQVQRIEYHPDYAILEVSNRQPDIAKRIEDINRNLVNDQTLDNPAIPS